MLLARAPPPLSAANSPAHPVRTFHPRRLATSRAAAAKAASFRGGQKHKQVASVANALVKHCVKLRLSAAYRRSCRRLLLIGLSPILEICRFEFATIDYSLLLDGVEVPEELHELAGNVVYVSAAVMKKVSGMQSVDSTKAIAVMHMPKYFCDLDSDEGGAVLDGLFHSPKRILVLDGIQDPGNLGTLIRSACAFKWDGIFLLPACCDPFNEKALRAARGASLQLPIVSGNWSDLHALVSKYDMKMLAGHPESSSDGSERIHALSKELADSLISEPLCLVLGSEGNGLSAETVQACELVSIPMEERYPCGCRASSINCRRLKAPEAATMYIAIMREGNISRCDHANVSDKLLDEGRMDGFDLGRLQDCRLKNFRNYPLYKLPD